MSEQPLNILTIDVEEYFEEASPETASKMESRLEEQMERTLALLSHHSAKATFFFLAKHAVRFPDLVRKTISAGHEVGSHAYDHVFLYKLPPSEQIRQIRQSKATLEDLSGRAVESFRAPYFSIVKSNSWLLWALLDSGYKFDSSIFPALHPSYGIPSAPSESYVLRFSDGRTLTEIPPATYGLGRFRFGVGGGGYLRMFPFSVTLSILDGKARNGRPIVLYFHPWELDPCQPRTRLVMPFAWRHYFNLEKTEARLEKLLSRYRFLPCNALAGVRLPEIPSRKLVTKPCPVTSKR